MKNKISLFTITLAFIGFCNHSKAQDINGIEVSGTTVFATTGNCGVCRITDDGNTWKMVLKEIKKDKIWDLVVSGSTVIAGAFGNSMISIDNGDHWKEVKMPGEYIDKCYPMAISGNTIIATGGHEGLVSRDSPFWLSTDEGQTWKASGYIGLEEFKGVYVNRANVYAVTAYNGVFLSTDNGLNWNQIKKTKKIFQIRNFSMNGKDIFIEGENKSGDNELFRLTEVGDLIPVTDRKDYDFIKMIFISGTTIYKVTEGYLYFSLNNGKDWISANKGFESIPGAEKVIEANKKLHAEKQKEQEAKKNADEKIIQKYALEKMERQADSTKIYLANIKTGGVKTNCSVTLGNNTYIGNAKGVFLSKDKGQNWTSVNNGLTNKEINQLVAIDNKIFASPGNNSTFLLIDNSLNWTTVKSDEKMGYIDDLVSNTDKIVGRSSYGVFSSNDGGLNWIKTKDLDLNFSFLLLGNNILANIKSQYSVDIIVGTTEFGLKILSPDGKRWDYVDGLTANFEVNLLTFNGDDIYAIISNKGAEKTMSVFLFKSSNDGKRWKKIEILKDNFASTSKDILNKMEELSVDQKQYIADQKAAKKASKEYDKNHPKQSNRERLAEINRLEGRTNNGSMGDPSYIGSTQYEYKQSDRTPAQQRSAPSGSNRYGSYVPK